MGNLLSFFKRFRTRKNFPSKNIASEKLQQIQIEISDENVSSTSLGNKLPEESKTSAPSRNESALSNKSGPHSEKSKVNSQTETIKLNVTAAEKWKPQYEHMLRPDARLDNLRRFHNIENSPYPLPADIEEQDRLEIQHLIITHCFGSLFTMPINEILQKPGARVLDVGCGPGSWTRDVAKKYPRCEVHAVDMAKTLFDEVESLPNTFFEQGNIIEGLPYPDNYFDAVFQRYLILGLPKDKWSFAINELRRVTKVGGYVECIEPYPKSENLGPNAQILNEGSVQAITLRGIDVEIYWNLADQFKSAGLKIESETPASFPIGWGGKIGELNLLNAKMAYEGMKPFLIKAFAMTGQEFDKLNNDAMEEYSEFKSYSNSISVVGQKL
ncbi:hypothetical protein HK096_007421 [Nowakowskiella sp. JEL0078]|nr:hypothetical protein HK096_007421 [Nowakowskiella sp. JEL0078]